MGNIPMAHSVSIFPDVAEPCKLEFELTSAEFELRRTPILNFDLCFEVIGSIRQLSSGYLT
jgi:hypothetical protein